MPGPLIPLIIAAGSWIANKIAERRAAKKQAQYNLSTQQSLNQQAFDQNVQMWKMQNAYNDPSAQMQRYSDAGLNPSLIYGQGGGSSGNASNYPTIEPARSERVIPAMTLPDVIGMYQTMQNRSATVNQKNADTELKNQKVQTEAVKRMNDMISGQRKQFDLDLATELRKYNVDIKRNESAVTKVKASIAAKQFSLLEQFGSAEKKSKLMTEAVNRARTVAGTASEQERLALMKQFGWTSGYQQSARLENIIDKERSEAMFSKLKTELFQNKQMTPSDNFFLRTLVQWLQSNGMSQEDIVPSTTTKPFPPR